MKAYTFSSNVWPFKSKKEELKKKKVGCIYIYFTDPYFIMSNERILTFQRFNFIVLICYSESKVIFGVSEYEHCFIILIFK